MENNAIMQRVMMLSEMWTAALVEHPQVTTFAWVGASSVEFKTINGFMMYQTSLEKTLADTVLYLAQVYDPEKRSYAENILTDLDAYFKAWNGEPDLVANSGMINWTPTERADTTTESQWFIENLTSLAVALDINGQTEKLVIALIPAAGDFRAFSGWIGDLIEVGIPNHIRVMLYESRDSMFYKKLEQNKGAEFKYLYPDLDIAGAMDQILEETKAKKQSAEERDLVSFQQGLIKMNESVAYGDEEVLCHYRDFCLKLANQYGWTTQAALVRFFEYSFYASINKEKEAHRAIDQAINITLGATQQKADTQIYQYYIAKGNLYFMSSKFEEAAMVYKTCLSLDRTGTQPLMLVGIHQMLGNSLRQSGKKDEAWDNFKSGWDLLSAEGEEALKENAMAMFYARDMLKAANEIMFTVYAPIMDSLWGNGWSARLEEQYQQMQKSI
ncbi:tetratricopeptide repeat protein [Pedobacter duraquae]|uniref:Tetratricopeptide repeat protein n=1 Tax=Pedobacter duraquae TaxID=425511 RepID=A0A4V6PSC8_9SPHI|nr:hypothetical protein [Pedobacter duraquae]TDO20929.1 hypothetical protein CLV32_3565 [Pedobacter duraquae]